MKQYLFFFFVIYSYLTYSQQVFQKTYGDVSDDLFYDLLKTASGSIYICGKNGIATNKDIAILKFTPNFEMEWSKTFGTSWDDGALRISELEDNTLLIAGYTNAFFHIEYTNYLVRIDPNGELIWSRIYGGDIWDLIYSRPVQDANGDIYFAGTTLSFGSGAKDVFLTKINPDGDIIWSKYYGTSFMDNDWGYDLDFLSNGNIILTGMYNHSFQSSTGGFLEIDTDGEIISFKSFNLNNHCLLYKSYVNENDEIVSVGRIIKENEDQFDGFVMKYSDGTVQWAKRFGSPELDYITSVQPVPDGGYVIAGYSDGFNSTSRDIFLIEISSEGEYEWGKLYGGNSNDAPRQVVVEVMEDGYLLGSGTTSFGSGGEDLYLVRTDENGLSGCYEQDLSPGFTGVELTEHTQIVISGYITMPQPATNTGEYSMTETVICIDTLNVNYPSNSDVDLPYIYPNPLKDLITIWFGYEISQGKLSIFTTNGKCLEDIQIHSRKSLKIDLRSLAKGTYILRLKDSSNDNVIEFKVQKQ